MDDHPLKVDIPPKVYIQTFGCQMNKYESEAIEDVLKKTGYVFTDNMNEAWVILLNTCSVRAHAEAKVFSLLGRLSILKQNNPSIIIGLLGCMAVQWGETLFKRYPVVDIAIGPDHIFDLPIVLEEIRKDRRHITITSFQDTPLPLSFGCLKNKFIANVPIILGCDNFCSYCVVPYVRGKPKSRPQSQIIDEINALVDNGIKEVILLGQDVCAYGKDLNEGINDAFALLLETLDGLAGLERIRFITAHPRDITPTLITTISSTKKVCEHLHLPLQSGSSRILNAMNRGYTAEFYQELITNIRKQIPLVSITTDIIVGFPSETEEEFEQTYRFVSQGTFDGAFIFKYSVRPQTYAASLKDDVLQEVKARRLEKLIAEQRKMNFAHNKKMVGRYEEILIEGENPRDSSSFYGRTRNNKMAFFHKDSFKPGQIVKVKITSASTFSLKGV